MGAAPGLSPARARVAALLVPVAAVLLQLCAAFNLDAETRVVLSGPRGTYFGYSVEFFSNLSR